MRFLEVLANPALRREIADRDRRIHVLEAQLADAEGRLRQQGDVLRSYHAWANNQPDPAVKLCVCADRHRFWATRQDLGADGLPNTDDDRFPERAP
jgi:hypothetical protein